MINLNLKILKELSEPLKMDENGIEHSKEGRGVVTHTNTILKAIETLKREWVV